MFNPLFIVVNGILGGMGAPELILIFLVILLLFGAKKIPDLARGLGKGIREFKDASKEVQKNVDDEIKELEARDKAEKAKKDASR